MGITTGNDTNNPFSIDINNKKDGAITGFEMEKQSYNKNVETILDELACHIEKYIDIDEILKISY